MAPIRSLSSQATTALMVFRNGNRTEATWPNPDERVDNVTIYQTIGNATIYLGRVVTTEIGAGLLCVTACAESVVYFILGIGSLPVSLLSNSDPTTFFFKLAGSSAFTIYWNVGTVVVFNPFCTMQLTHESFARFAMEEWPRGLVLRLVILTGRLVGAFFGIKIPENFTPDEFMRIEDTLYIVDWWIQNSQNLQAQNLQLDDATNEMIREITGFGDRTLTGINKGINSFYEKLLNNPNLSAETKQKILNCDPEIYIFAITRLIFFYVLIVPPDQFDLSFFKRDVADQIIQLRNEVTASGKGNDLFLGLAQRMRDPKLFAQDIPEAQAQNDKFVFFKKLRTIAHGELRGSILLTRCWGAACARYRQEHPELVQAQ